MVTKGIVYVPAAGLSGSQLESSELPRVANRPLVGLILDALARDGIESFVVAAADPALAQVRAALVDDPAAALDVSFLGLGPEADLLAALRAGAAFTGDDPALVHLATGLLGQSAAAIVRSGDTGAPDLTLLLHQGHQSSTPLDADTERLLGISELGGCGSRLSLAGVAAFGPGAVARIAADSKLTAAMAPTLQATEPATAAGELVALADTLVGDGLSVAAGTVGEWCDYSAAPEMLLELNRCVLDRQEAARSRPAEDSGNRIEGRVIIDPSADVRSSVIIGPSLIGPRARIADAYIGPYTTVGADAVIEGAEVVRSIVGDGAEITHVRGRIEGSTIGRGAHIFRDFTLPHALRLHVGAGVEVSLV